jgi:Lon protease-like protein
MFPLGTVLFPFAELPLHVFEPRYRLMMRHVLDRDREFGVVLIERGSEVGGGDVRFDVGTIASLTRAQDLPDGRWLLSTVGLQRFRVVEWLPDDPYPRARIEEIRDPPSGPPAHAERDRLESELRELHREVARDSARASEAGVSLSEDPVRASYEAVRFAALGPLDAQRVLEIDDPVDRMRTVRAAVRDRVGLLLRHPPPDPDGRPEPGDTLPP